MKILNIYTDGGYRDTLKLGACGYIIVENSGNEINRKVFVFEKDNPSFPSTFEVTNNTMEMVAVIKSLNWLKSNGYNPQNHRIYVYTDSQYVQLGLTEWIINWKRNNWKNASKKLVKNKELWIVLDNLWSFDFPYLHLQWVQGHDGNHYNEEVDKMCTNAMLTYKIDDKNIR